MRLIVQSHKNHVSSGIPVALKSFISLTSGSGKPTGLERSNLSITRFTPRYDYFCCPQGTSREATLKRQMAIDSIPIYVVTWYEVYQTWDKRWQMLASFLDMQYSVLEAVRVRKTFPPVNQTNKLQPIKNDQVLWVMGDFILNPWFQVVTWSIDHFNHFDSPDQHWGKMFVLCYFVPLFASCEWQQFGLLYLGGQGMVPLGVLGPTYGKRGWGNHHHQDTKSSYVGCKC